jgi:hypothetical protein
LRPLHVVLGLWGVEMTSGLVDEGMDTGQQSKGMGAFQKKGIW